MQAGWLVSCQWEAVEAYGVHCYMQEPLIQNKPGLIYIGDLMSCVYDRGLDLD